MTAREENKKLHKNMRYVHFKIDHHRNDQGKWFTSYATVALSSLDNEEYHFGITFCSPMDRFSRRKGRVEAIRKFFTYSFYYKPSQKNLRIFEVAKEIIEEAIRETWRAPHLKLGDRLEVLPVKILNNTKELVDEKE